MSLPPPPASVAAPALPTRVSAPLPPSMTSLAAVFALPQKMLPVPEPLASTVSLPLPATYSTPPDAPT